MDYRPRQFRLYAEKCQCDARPELPSDTWKSKRCKPPQRTVSDGSWDEIRFQARDRIAAIVACTVFAPLHRAIMMHERHGCAFQVQEEVAPGDWQKVV